MKVALTSRHTGEVTTLRASVENRVGFSLRGHLYLCLETQPSREFTWEQWNECKGVVVTITGEERNRFDRWVENGRDYAAKWWSKQA